jgi:hypothetical protein
MKVTNKDIDRLGINYIATDTVGNVVALKGVLPQYHKTTIHFMTHRFSKITDKIIYWAELEIDYCGG